MLGRRGCLDKLRAGSVHMGNDLRAPQASCDAFLSPPHAIRPQHARRRAGYHRWYQLDETRCEAATTFAEVPAAMSSARRRHTKHFSRIHRGSAGRNFRRQRDEPIEIGSSGFRSCALDNGEHRSAFRVRLSAGAQKTIVFSQAFHESVSKEEGAIPLDDALQSNTFHFLWRKA
jgi:hypothetical protein